MSPTASLKSELNLQAAPQPPATETPAPPGRGTGAGLKASTPVSSSLRAANQSSIFDKRARGITQLALGMPRGMRVASIGVRESQSTALSANSGRRREPIGKKRRLKTEEAVCLGRRNQGGGNTPGGIQVPKPPALGGEQ